MWCMSISSSPKYRNYGIASIIDIFFSTSMILFEADMSILFILATSSFKNYRKLLKFYLFLAEMNLIIFFNWWTF